MDCGNRPECSEIADRAVKKTFAILGVDIDKPESVEEFRQDLRFGKRLRKIADHSMMAFVSVVIVAMAGALWIGITHKIKGD
jgi:23S rRNA U2552 (ribose-2'-O)-methylase RlmE/FtsJ